MTAPRWGCSPSKGLQGASWVSPVHCRGPAVTVLLPAGPPALSVLAGRSWTVCIFADLTMEQFPFRILQGLLIFPCEATDGELHTEGFSDVHRTQFCKQMVSINKHCDSFLPDGHHPLNELEDSLPDSGRAPAGAGFSHLVNFPSGLHLPPGR